MRIRAVAYTLRVEGIEKMIFAVAGKPLVDPEEAKSARADFNLQLKILNKQYNNCEI